MLILTILTYRLYPNESFMPETCPLVVKSKAIAIPKPVLHATIADPFLGCSSKNCAPSKGC